MRIHVTQPEDWVEAFRQQAEKEGSSLSEWIGEKCKDALPKLVQAKLSVRQGVGPRPQE